MSVRLGKYGITVPDGLRDNLENELNGWDTEWLEKMAANEPLELRFMIGEWLGVDIRHVHIEEHDEARNPYASGCPNCPNDELIPILNLTAMWCKVCGFVGPLLEKE